MSIWMAPLGTPPGRTSRSLRIRLWIAQHILRLSVWHQLGVMADPPKLK